jgi:hypothetical protein
VKHFGIEGGAVAWFFRVTLDTVLLFIIAGRACDLSNILSNITRYCMVIVTLLLLVVVAITNPYVNGAVALTGMILFAVAAWKTMLLPEERLLLTHKTNIMSKLVR